MHDLARRRPMGLAAAVATVMMVGAATFALTVDRTHPTPAPPRPGQTDERSGTPRPLVYAEGESIHVGDQTIDVGADVVFVEATDDGVVFITGGRLPTRPSGQRPPHPHVATPAPLWFTDGSNLDQIGLVDMQHVYDFAVATANPGSLIAWLSVQPGIDTTQLHHQAISVYDSHQRRVVARVPVSDPLETAAIEHIVVSGDRIYWEYGSSVARYDVSTETQETVSWSSYRADLARSPRMLAFGNASDQGGPPPVVAQRLAAFMQIGDRLVPTDNIHYGSHGSEIPTTRPDGQPIELRVPAGYDAETTSFVVVQWLNDDHLVLFAYHQHNELPAHVGDILVCPVPSGTCEIQVSASESTPYVPPGDVY